VSELVDLIIMECLGEKSSERNERKRLDVGV
jgi:hypothetical protein